MSASIVKFERVALRDLWTHEAHNGGGYRSSQDEWPELQDAIIKDMDRLETALRPYLKQLKLNA